MDGEAAVETPHGKQVQRYKGVLVLTMKRGEGERIAARVMVDRLEREFPAVFSRLYGVVVDTRKVQRRVQLRCDPGLTDWCETDDARSMACWIYAWTGCNHTIVSTDYPKCLFVEEDEYEAWATKQRQKETVE
jgi:hypothetical protein